MINCEILDADFFPHILFASLNSFFSVQHRQCHVSVIICFSFRICNFLLKVFCLSFCLLFIHYEIIYILSFFLNIISNFFGIIITHSFVFLILSRFQICSLLSWKNFLTLSSLIFHPTSWLTNYDAKRKQHLITFV